MKRDGGKLCLADKIALIEGSNNVHTTLESIFFKEPKSQLSFLFVVDNVILVAFWLLEQTG